MPSLNSMADVMRELAKLTELNQGWKFFAAHDMERASFGMMALRRVGPDGKETTAEGEGVTEETLHYEWLPYGKRLEPVITVASDVEQFRSMVNDMRPRGIFRCDNPRQRLIGFVSYDEDKAHVVYVSVTKFKEGMYNLDKGLVTEIQIGSCLEMEP